MRSLHKIALIVLLSVLSSTAVCAEEPAEVTLPYPVESDGEFSAKLPVNDLLIGDLVYINFDIKSERNIFAFEAEINYDSDDFLFSDICSDAMDIAVSDGSAAGTVRFAASQRGDGRAISGDSIIKLILKAKTSGNSSVILKNAVLIYDDLSYTEFNDIKESINVSVKKAPSTSKPSFGGGGGGGGFSVSYYPSGSISVEATPTPAPTDIAPIEETNNSDISKENISVFTDITDVEWAREAIEALSAKNIINGVGNGLFNPLGRITRAEFAKIIVLADEISVEGAECAYNDVSSDEWYYAYIAAATENNLLNGYASGEFRPDGYITREEMAVVCARALSAEEVPEISAVNFNDKSEISDFAYDSVCMLYTMGIISGDDNGNFNPKSNLSRAEAAKVIYILTGGGK